MRKPARKTAAAASAHTGQTGRDPGAARPRRAPIHARRATRYTSGGYASGTLQKTSPRLKNQSEIENESSASRSRLRRLRSRRQSASPITKAAQNASQIGALL